MNRFTERLPAFIFGLILLGAGITMMANNWYFMMRGQHGSMRIEGLGVIDVAVIFLLFQVHFYRQKGRKQEDWFI
jgi:hypothetical protein